MSGRQIKRFLAWVLALAVVFFVFLWIGFAVRSYRNFHAGERTASEGAEILAQGYYERSIRSHCPWNVWGKRSAERLEAMARKYEKYDNIERAIDTYEALLTALAGTDTGWSRWRKETIAHLEQKIAALRKTMAEKSE